MDFLNSLATLPLFLNFILFGIGVFILVKGSDVFIDSAVYFAYRFHVSEIVIGLTLVSIGTSLPELATNINSALKARSVIAIGNITGSNITNIALVIGISAIIVGRISIPKKLFTRDMIFMLGVSTLLLVFSYFFDGSVFRINRIESIIMISLLIFYIIYLFRFNQEDIIYETKEVDKLKIKTLGSALLFLFLGILCISLGSEIMIRNIIIIADRMKISDGVIGATIVALATSIPELSVTIIGIMKNRAEIGLGNIVGSNIINILGVLGITGLIGEGINIINVIDGTPDKMMLYFTLPFMIFIAICLYIFMLIKMKLGRIKGILLLLLYIGFVLFNYIGLPT